MNLKLDVAALLGLAGFMFTACQSNPTCSNSDVSGVCATHSFCKTEWPQDPKSFCDGASWSIAECAGYRVAERMVVDVGDRYYYDAHDGKLVAIVHVGNNTGECSAGPANFETPSCIFQVIACYGPVDAGTTPGGPIDQ